MKNFITAFIAGYALVVIGFIGYTMFKRYETGNKASMIQYRILKGNEWLDAYKRLPQDSILLQGRTLDSISRYVDETDSLIEKL